MPVDPRNFEMHRAVVATQMFDDKNQDAAQRYVDAVERRIVNDFHGDADAGAKLAELRGYLLGLIAVADMARRRSTEVDEYLGEFLGET